MKSLVGLSSGARFSAVSLAALSVSLCFMPVATNAHAVAAQATQDKQKTASTLHTQAATPASPAGQTPPPTDSATNITTLTVTASKPEVTHKIDRDVYDVKQDPQAATGTASDVLNNVPAVTVDPDGTVSLRGNSSVQVYVNGKKSSQMQGDNKGFTLQTLNADDIDSVEVIPNPSAAFGSDSAGGIINIVMKRGRNIKPQTSVNAVLGDEGRDNIALRTGKTFGKLTLNGSLSFNHGAGGSGGSGGGRGGGGGPKSKSFSDRFQLDPLTGDVLSENKTYTVSKSDSRTTSGNMNAVYNLTDDDNLEANFDYRGTQSSNLNTGVTTNFDASHILTGERTSLRDSDRGNENMNVDLTYDHKGPIGTTEDFKMRVSHSQNLSDRNSEIHTLYEAPLSPGRPDTYSAQASKTKDYIDEFSGDWSHPITDNDKGMEQLALGWDVTHTVSDQYNYNSLSEPSAVTSPAFPRSSSVTQFNDDEMLSAFYTTYEKKVGKFGYQTGLRFEHLDQTVETWYPTNLPILATRFSHNSLNYSPSLFLTYDLTDKDRLKLVYTQKIQRPQASQLNPLIIYSEDGLTARSGNANLKPERIDKYELDYDRTPSSGLMLSGKLHYDQAAGAINSVVTYIPSQSIGQPEIPLTTVDNSGSRRTTGGDMSIGFTTPKRTLGVMFSANYNYVVYDFTDFVTKQAVHKAGPNSGMSLRLRYKATPKDSFVFGGNYVGQQTTTVGYTGQVVRLNASYVHQIVLNKVVLTVNASNFLVGPTSKSVSETSVSRGYSYTFNPGANFMVSLRYTFGTPGRQRDGQGFGGGRGGGYPGSGGYAG